MKLTASLRTDDDDRLFAKITDSTTGDLVNVITDAGDLRRPFRDQVTAWARDNGHTVDIHMEGIC